MPWAIRLSNWVIMALMVSWLRGELVEGAERCSAAASSRGPLGALGDDPLLGADGGEHLGLDPAVERRCGRLGDVGRGADDVLGQSEGVQRGLGLPAAT